jgi:hypothetical protein
VYKSESCGYQLSDRALIICGPLVNKCRFPFTLIHWLRLKNPCFYKSRKISSLKLKVTDLMALNQKLNTIYVILCHPCPPSTQITGVIFADSFLNQVLQESGSFFKYRNIIFPCQLERLTHFISPG